jgi:hypothetical protein
MAKRYTLIEEDLYRRDANGRTHVSKMPDVRAIMSLRDVRIYSAINACYWPSAAWQDEKIKRTHVVEDIICYF